jgi:MarR family 2-MHQ and catechol resistance regulon transcriptional repressor
MRATAKTMHEDVRGVHVWLVLWKAHDAIRANAEHSIAELGMCLTDFGVLEALLHKGPLSVNALGGKLGLTSGSATTAIDRLVERGLVERTVAAADRRARIVALTRTGRALVARAFAEHELAMDRAVAGLGDDERALLVGLLKTLGRQAEQRLTGDEKAQQAAPVPLRPKRSTTTREGRS